MNNFSLFTFDLLLTFIIPTSQQDELRDKLKQLGLVFLLGIFHPLLLCLKALSVSKFFENVVVSSRCFSGFYLTP